jgi:hypothetical protein
MAMMLVGASALVLGGLTPPAVADGGGGSETVVMQDRCDPATFNAAFPGICAAHGGETVLLDRLVARLVADPAGVLADRAARGWRFHDDHVTLDAGQRLVVKNTGGEMHTFTQVPVYGLGCFALLRPIFAPVGEPDACDPVAGAASRVLPGATRTLSLGAGMYRFECLVHPWMRTDVTVKS